MKKWYNSKMLWVNLIALIAVAAQVFTGKEIMNAETQTVILAFINFVLRTITTTGIE